MSTKAEWKTKIITACQEAGTYRPFFDDVINTLAAIMEIRDSAVEQYEKSGGNPVVAHTNKGGHTNIVKNPALAIINEQNQQALAYWRDLGLTPRGFKQLNGDAVQKKETTFEDVLSKLEI
jgi:phage terminase small subunit